MQNFFPFDFIHQIQKIIFTGKLNDLYSNSHELKPDGAWIQGFV